MSITITDTLKFRESVNDDWQRLMIQANINFNLIYPVGSIYMSTVNVNPATLFGGTWEQLEDRFLLGAGTTYTAGDTGGEATHTLTTDEMPSHGHRLQYYNSNGTLSFGYNFGNKGSLSGSDEQSSSGIAKTGEGQAHNNMPPYIVVYMWKRLTLSPSLTPLPMNVLGDVASEDIVPVSKGGTGADNVADARTNLGAIHGFGTKTRILSFPYTTPSDGFLHVIARASANGRAYVNFTNICICDFYNSAGGYGNLLFPLSKGVSLSSPTTSNTQSVEYYFYPLE